MTAIVERYPCHSLQPERHHQTRLRSVSDSDGLGFISRSFTSSFVQCCLQREQEPIANQVMIARKVHDRLIDAEHSTAIITVLLDLGLEIRRNHLVSSGILCRVKMIIRFFENVLC